MVTHLLTECHLCYCFPIFNFVLATYISMLLNNQVTRIRFCLTVESNQPETRVIQQAQTVGNKALTRASQESARTRGLKMPLAHCIVGCRQIPMHLLDVFLPPAYAQKIQQKGLTTRIRQVPKSHLANLVMAEYSISIEFMGA